MSAHLATSPASPLSERTSAFDGAFVRDANPAKLFSSWPASVPAPAARSRELGAVLALSAFLHAGVVLAACRTDQEPRSTKRLSRVEVELTRAPAPPRPAARPVAPPPLKAAQREKRPAASPPNRAEAPVTPHPLEAPTDTGSSAAAEEGGELQAGNDGLGNVEIPPAPPAPAPIAQPVIQAREGANYLRNPRPSYPRHAKRQGLEGTALLRIQVQASGKPSAITIHQSSGHDLLDEAAVEAVKRWTFMPATRGGEPVAGSVLVPIVFRLQ